MTPGRFGKTERNQGADGCSRRVQDDTFQESHVTDIFTILMQPRETPQRFGMAVQLKNFHISVPDGLSLELFADMNCFLVNGLTMMHPFNG